MRPLIKGAFEYAYRVLQRAVSPQAESYPVDCTQSILGRIIMITDEVYQYRNWVYQNWSRKVPRLQPLEPEKPKKVMNGAQSPVRVTDCETDPEVEENEASPSPQFEPQIEEKLAGFSSNDEEEPHETDNSGEVSDDLEAQHWREKERVVNEIHRDKRNFQISIPNQRVQHQNIQRTIHQDRTGGHTQTHRRSRDGPLPPNVNRHHKSGSRDQREDEVFFQIFLKS